MNIRPDFQQHGLRDGIVLRGRVHRIAADVAQRQRQHRARGVLQADTAARGDARRDRRIEQQVHAVDGHVLAEDRADLRAVISHAHGAPHVGNAVLIAGIGLRHQFQQRGVEILEVRQLALVELKKCAGLDLLRHEVIGRPYQVVATVPRHQLGLQCFVAVVRVIADLDAGFLLELGQGVRGEIIAPVVQIQYLLFLCLGLPCKQVQTKSKSGERRQPVLFHHVFLTDSRTRRHRW